MFLEDRRGLSRSDLRQRIKAAGGDDDSDLIIDLLLREIDRRKAIAPECYPFETSEAGLRRTDAVAGVLYEFLLLLAVSPLYRKEGRVAEIDVQFDNIVKAALQNQLGPDAVAVRFAHPSSDGRPTNFPEAVKWLADLLGLGTGAGIALPKRRDGGVDVAVWRPFRDRKFSFLVVLCQCTVQTDWQPKSQDVVEGLWLGYIDFGMIPVRALAIPFVVPPAFAGWDEIRRSVNLLLDRMRMCELLGATAIPFADELVRWNDKEKTLLLAAVGQTSATGEPS
jgi:hypothetical protein